MNIFFENETRRHTPSFETDFSDWSDDIVKFVVDNQLKNEKIWRAAEYPFFNNGSGISEDSTDAGWRGEFWGKTMRGACMVYKYTKDKELYDILKETVNVIISSQDENGRISTYSEDKEFFGWDIWGRKYVMLGMIYFHEICMDENFKKAITESLKKQLDYIVDRVGDKEGQIDIKSTSYAWGAVNSNTILEPVMYIYILTKARKYLDFARYIVRGGGAIGCNLIESALNSKLLPYQYPIVKAYEIMSFFEGLIEFYAVTKEAKIKKAVCEFADKILRSEITVIGCAGCTHEFFDNAVVMQSSKEIYNGHAQETCVTVTWMDFCSRMLLLTGNAKFADAIETSAYNALFGVVNTERSNHNGGLTFDSYSPVQIGVRGDGIAGLKVVDSYSIRGCCDAIGALGIGLFPVNAVVKTDDGAVINFYINGCFEVQLKDKTEVKLEIVTNYPYDGKISIKVMPEKKCEFELKLRIPGFSKNTECRINGEYIKADTGYLCINREWYDGDTVELELDMNPRVELPAEGNNFICVKYGPLVLARDARFKENIKEAVLLDYDDESLNINLKKTSKKMFTNFVEFETVDKNGNVISLTDYASAGKTWDEESEMTAWMPVG